MRPSKTHTLTHLTFKASFKTTGNNSFERKHKTPIAMNRNNLGTSLSAFSIQYYPERPVFHLLIFDHETRPILISQILCQISFNWM